MMVVINDYFSTVFPLSSLTVVASGSDNSKIQHLEYLHRYIV